MRLISSFLFGAAAMLLFLTFALRKAGFPAAETETVRPLLKALLYCLLCAVAATGIFVLTLVFDLANVPFLQFG